MLGEVIPHAGCQALYHLEADGTDSSGNGLHLTMQPSAQFATGKFGNGLSDNDNTWAYNWADHGVDLRTNVFGISFWFKLSYQPGSGYGYEYILWRGRYGTHPDYTYRFVRITYCQPSGESYKIQLQVNQNYGTLASFTATLGQWYKCDVTSDGTYNYLYINGVQYIKQEPGIYGSTYSSSISIFGNGLESIPGMMDEVAFFNYHRTEQDIARQYAFERGMLA